MQHDLKIWPRFFEEVITGVKACQLRQNDRNFQIGDSLKLQEYVKEKQLYTGRETTVLVTDVIQDCDGLVPGYCILSVKLPVNNLMNFNAGIAGKGESA